jgi:hypothetical protein
MMKLKIKLGWWMVILKNKNKMKNSKQYFSE